MESGHQDNGGEHLAINNTFFRRFLTLLALHTTAKFYSRNGICFPISKRKIVKRSTRVHLTEGATMKYLAENTSIPVPKGESLPLAWDSLSEESLEDVFTQLKGIFQELRSLTPPPGTGVESCAGGSMYDHRMSRQDYRFGPFKTINEFHLWLRRDFKLEDIKDRPRDQDWHDLAEMTKQQDGPWPPPKFSHGDLNPTNILVRDGKVVGIIDWEFSGWYPDYWEYTSAWFGNVIREGWQRKIDKFLDRPSPETFKMEEIRCRAFGDYYY
ncbi:hypothetical protein ONZ43_g3600 [Nemania bipapillata]|uniref:Uncharacterized protein n=1 Tax=Nemania bipapillata TaxID=110536 RepID=A0ACC2IW50_9PEZI|nr:hypothetical protein ONZ43_g3600 [Nemania bipapillata]